MSMLAYKTRGTENPKGKPKVFFCCHPKDFDTYFEKISAEILKRENCAVWYNASPEDEYDEMYFNDLGQMQLFVIPVTSRFLCESNRALEQEFTFAVENHIPVLPLMQEHGLEQLFNQKCGDLQFLDEHNTDKTAISYDKKLSKILDTVLVGDELAEKIRAAFSGYVFLSYRKKDRQHAQKLMKLIHKNDFCRDIAIWYDEFLTPGENFNSEIESAVKKCGSFILTVTPNLVNEPNYIITTEYPIARHERKMIVPVELVKTDKAALEDSFVGIPECASADDETELSRVLFGMVEQMNIQKHEDTPRHKYLMGIAYLNGVDVEVDHEKALKLLTEAAEGGHKGAINRLVSMYENGEGVSRDYETAIMWQRKVVTLLCDRYNENRDKDTAEELVSLLYLLTLNVKDLYRYEEASELYGTLEAFLKNAPELEQDFAENYLWRVYNGLGRINSNIGKLETAEAYYRKAYDIAVAMSERGTADCIENLASSCDDLGGVYVTRGDYETAREYYLKSLEIKLRGLEDGGTDYELEDVAAAYDALGKLCLEEGQLERARKYAESAIEIRSKILNDDSTYVRAGKAISNELLCEICRKGEDYEKALEYGIKCIEIDEGLYKDSELPMYLIALEESYRAVGEIYDLEMRTDLAKENFLKALECVQKIIEIAPDNIDARREYSWILFRFANISEGQERIEYFEKCAEIRKQLCDEVEDMWSDMELADVYSTLGGAYSLQNDYAKTEEFYLKAFELYEKVRRKADTPHLLDSMTRAYIGLGLAYLSQDEFMSAEKYFKSAYEITLKLCEDSDAARYKHLASTILSNIGDCKYFDDDANGAEEYYVKSLEIAEELYKNAPNRAAADELAKGCSYLAEAYIEMEEYEKAEALLYRATELLSDIASDGGDISVALELANRYRGLGRSCEAVGRFSSAAEFFKNSLDLCLEICKESGSEKDFKELAECYGDHYRFFIKTCEYGKTLEFSEKLLETYEKLYCSYGDKYFSEYMSAFGAVGDSYRLMEDYESAMEYYEKALEHDDELYESDKNALAGIFSFAAVCALTLGDKQKAKKYILNARGINIELIDEGRKTGKDYDEYYDREVMCCYYAGKILRIVGEVDRSDKYFGLYLNYMKERDEEEFGKDDLAAMADAYFCIGELELARDLYREVVKILPENKEATERYAFLRQLFGV